MSVTQLAETLFLLRGGERELLDLDQQTPERTPPLALPPPPRFELRKIKHIGVIKWIEVYANVLNQVGYAEFIQAVKSTCEIGEADEIVIKDDDGAVIDAELFDCFPGTLVFHVITPGTTTGVLSTATSLSVSSLTASNVSSLSDITNVSETSVPSKKRKLDDLNIVEGIKSSFGGKDIVEEYERTQTLSADTRRKLVNIVVNLMIEKFGNHPSSEQKTRYAKSIVKAFPKLKDPESEEGYVKMRFILSEAFFDPETRCGYLSWRLRTINRKSGDKDSNGKKKKVAGKQKLKDELDSATPSTSTPVDDSEVEVQLNFLRNACPAMKSTFHLRRNEPTKILELFPRFLDTPYLINVDFALMHPNVKLSNFRPADILKVAATHLSTSSKSSILAIEAGWCH